MAKRNKKLSHPILFNFAKTIYRVIAYFKLGYRRKGKYKIGKNERVLVLSNHQTDYDPLLIHLSLNKFVRCLGTENIFAGKTASKLLKYLGAIPKKKGITDVASVIEIMKAINIGDSVLIFPEGNRSYAEFQFPIDEGIAKLIKKLKCTLLIFNFHGGFGKFPRIGSKPRRGKFYGEIKQVLKYDEYKDIDDQKLYELIKDSLRVFDSESDNLYKSRKKAEYFERLFFICPKCGKLQTIYSKGSHIRCSNCDLDIEYGEDLLLHSNNPDVNVTRLVDWYNYQKQFIANYDFSKLDIIFEDDIVQMNTARPGEKKTILAKKAKLKLTNKQLIVGDIKIDLKDVVIASPVSGKKLWLTTTDNNYVIRGKENFNAIKYVFLFNVLDTKMRNDKLDIYYRVDE